MSNKWHFVVDVGGWTLDDLTKNLEEFRKGDVERDLITDPNYNMCVSVSHPSFICEYAVTIYPALSDERKIIAKKYLEFYKHLLNEEAKAVIAN